MVFTYKVIFELATAGDKVDMLDLAERFARAADEERAARIRAEKLLEEFGKQS